MTKAELRKHYRAIRSSLTEQETNRFNEQIISHLLAFSWEDVRYVHCFLPIGRHKEPDMWAFMDIVQERFPNLQMVVSRSNVIDFSMVHYLFSRSLILTENEWGIVEPLDGERVVESLLDVVLVPLLVADDRGNRVGYGKGFYDRFLARCRPDCVKIGISFFEPVELITDVDTLDIPLDKLVTPLSVFDFKAS
ncbi:5-formyltetrahydrofolate cyclo-ligase [Sphingobacterium suaedae]|uniref:5-formyltetrahydrofolate cyclo-ligase n=1 Tax=Sphingobacterium suaedae TaxID=1686402 RepID=A0ABW5KLK0_9SPHI